MTRSRLDRPPIELPTLSGPLALVWEALATLSKEIDDLPWTIVGGQMVLLHGLEHERNPHRVSSDIDAAVDVRADPCLSRANLAKAASRLANIITIQKCLPTRL